MRVLEASKPTVSRRWLLVLSGLMWAGVGVMLNELAIGWLSSTRLTTALPLGAAGLLAGVVVYRRGFCHLAAKNIRRIDGLPERVGLWAFQSGKSYVLIVFMMGLGMTLRRSPLPKPWLAVIYMAIGGGLFLSSLLYVCRLTDVCAFSPVAIEGD